MRRNTPIVQRGRTGAGRLARIGSVLLLVGAVVAGLAAVTSRSGASAAAGTFPLSVSTDGRRLVDASGANFLAVGDAGWEIFTNASLADADAYIANRKAQGFNTILAQIVDSYYSTRSPADLDGNQPFLTPGDFSTPNPVYWARADQVMAKMSDAGFLVILNPAYYGWGPDGWWNAMVANGAPKMYAYGQWIAQRYASYQNIIWEHGVDRCPGDNTLASAVPNGIRSILPNAIQEYHADRGLTPADCGLRTQPWMTMDTIYTTTDVATPALKSWNQTPAKPYLDIEAQYENDPGVSAQQLRQQAYSSVVNGGVGYVFGNGTTWQFASGWQSALTTAGTRAMTVWANLVRPLGGITPSQTAITSGLGSGDTRASAGVAANSSFVVYVPTARAVTVNVPSSGTKTVYDTVTGAVVSTSTVPAGPQVFTPVGSADQFVVVAPGSGPTPTTVAPPTTMAPPTTIGVTTTAVPTTTPATTTATTGPATTTPATTSPATTAPTGTTTATTVVTCHQAVQVLVSGTWRTRYVDMPASYCSSAHA